MKSECGVTKVNKIYIVEYAADFNSMLLRKTILLIAAQMILLIVYPQQIMHTDVLVVGGGTGGTAAGIQCARMNVKTIITEEGTWLGGMLSSAGVSATDGNNKLPSGIWNEFREAIYKVYGGADKVATGWVSDTHFEPHIADSIFKAMAAKEKNLTVLYHHQFLSVLRKNNQILGAVFINTLNGKKITVYAKQVIEATELGDVIAAVKIPFDLGMESGAATGEDAGVNETNSIIQDLTYVAILKDYCAGADKTITKPVDYTPEEFDGACTNYYNDKSREAPAVDKKKMLDYAKLPNGKYMINWPNYGNDVYLEIINLTPQQRNVLLEKAKQQTLRFVYFIQTQLGFKNLGLADDEFDTKDKLACMPYYRESRRVQGLARLKINHIAKPFDYGYYRTGIAVGDYPIDHHHKKNPAAPQHLDFYSVPSYNIPLGSLIPQNVSGLIVCDKSISVSNVVNGTTRLQPVVLLTGQTAGLLAALCVRKNKEARAIPVREVQQELLNNNAMIMPYIDAGINHPHFKSIQKVGATGILKGRGIPYKWANQTWFYPDSFVLVSALTEDIKSFEYTVGLRGEYLNIGDAADFVYSITMISKERIKNKGVVFSSQEKFMKYAKDNWSLWSLQNFNTDRKITRAELAVLLDKTIDPFWMRGVNYDGNFTE
jgi:FAD dependent oxidoreductase